MNIIDYGDIDSYANIFVLQVLLVGQMYTRRKYEYRQHHSMKSENNIKNNIISISNNVIVGWAKRNWVSRLTSCLVKLLLYKINYGLAVA